MKRTFNKPATTYQQQIAKLQQRGMIIDNPTEAAFYLQQISYYRLGAYWLPFEADHKQHTFKKGTQFQAVVDSYVFDRELRLLLLDAIERIEVSVRAHWAYILAHKYGPHGYLKNAHTSDSTLHTRHLSKLRKEIDRSDEVFITHYNKTYRSPALPPIWAISEIMSLGMLSRWVTHMLPADRALIAKVYGIDESVLKSFIQHLTYVRNLSAHHSRVWNRRFTITMRLPRSKPQGLANQFQANSRYIYNTLVMILHFMNLIAPHHSWRNRFFMLVKKYNVPLAAMGFPKDWQQRAIWQTENELVGNK